MNNNMEFESILQEIDLSADEPIKEPQRQYYFIKKCREYVKGEVAKLGRPLLFYTTTFGCQMNARDSEKLEGILEQIGYIDRKSTRLNSSH